MDIKITVDIPALDRLVDVLNAQISGAPAVGIPTMAKAEKPKAEPAKAEKPKAEPAKEEPKVETEEPAGDTDKPVDAVEYPAVKKLILDLVAKKGRDAATTLLGEYGAKGGGDLKAEDYASFAAKAEALING